MPIFPFNTDRKIYLHLRSILLRQEIFGWKLNSRSDRFSRDSKPFSGVTWILHGALNISHSDTLELLVLRIRDFYPEKFHTIVPKKRGYGKKFDNFKALVALLLENHVYDHSQWQLSWFWHACLIQIRISVTLHYGNTFAFFLFNSIPHRRPRRSYKRERTNEVSFFIANHIFFTS